MLHRGKVIDPARPKHSTVFRGRIPRITDEVTGLCIDGEVAYERSCGAEDVPRHECDAERGGAPGQPDAQHANDFRPLLKTWVRPFRGGASEHPDRCTSWFVFGREAAAECSRGRARQELLVRTARAQP